MANFFTGTVKKFHPCAGEVEKVGLEKGKVRADWWKVVYEDDDQEEIDYKELASILVV